MVLVLAIVADDVPFATVAEQTAGLRAVAGDSRRGAPGRRSREYIKLYRQRDPARFDRPCASPLRCATLPLRGQYRAALRSSACDPYLCGVPRERLHFDVITTGAGARAPALPAAP